MARLPILILLLGVSISSVRSLLCSQGPGFTMLRNDRSQLLSKRVLIDAATISPNNFRVVRSSAKDIHGVQWYQLKSEVQGVPPCSHGHYGLIPGIVYHNIYREGAMSPYGSYSMYQSVAGHAPMVDSVREVKAIQSVYNTRPKPADVVWVPVDDIAAEGKTVTERGIPLEDIGCASCESGLPKDVLSGEEYPSVLLDENYASGCNAGCMN